MDLGERQNPDVLPLARLLPQGKRLKLTSFLEIYLKIQKYVQLIKLLFIYFRKYFPKLVGKGRI